MTICERQSGGRILCHRLSGLGDIVHALNALSLLHVERPDAHIAWAVEERFADLLRNHPCIDELIPIPRKAWGRMLLNPFRWPAFAREFARFKKRIRAGRYDATVDFQSSFKSSWLVRAANAPLRIGFDRPINRELNWRVQNCLVRVPHQGVHRIERDVALLAPLGIRARVAKAALPVRYDARRAVQEGLRGRLKGGPLVVMHPGTSRFAAFKRWDAARYARVADALIEARGADVVVSSGPEDREMAAEVVRRMRHPAVDTPPTADLGELIALLARAQLFIGSDTGPMHMAGALGVPVVSLFGPKDAVQTGPYTSRSIVVTADVACRPCTHRRCPAAPRGGAPCMRAISTGQVIRAALEVLDGGGECRARPGLLRKPFSHAFKLGDWRGRVTAAYSYAAFFTRLCEPDTLVHHTGTGSVDAVPEAPVGHAPRDGAGWPGLTSRRYRTPRAALRDLRIRARLHRAWRVALALVRDGVPTPFPACHVARESGRDTLLISEHFEHGLSLREWAAAGAADEDERRRVIETVATLMQTVHRAGWWGAPFDADNVLVRVGALGGDCEAVVTAPERLWPMHCLPLFARDVLAAWNLRRLAAAAGVRLSLRDGVRFLRAYWQGAKPPLHRRRLIARRLKSLVRNPMKPRSRPHG